MRYLGLLLCAIFLTSCYGSPAPPIYDTIVVGLGASGTAAATNLAKAGKKVLALEAQDRIGGRVYTMPFGDSIVEVGAEWIHGSVLSPTYELAIQNNVTILPQDTGLRAYFSDGSTDRQEIIMDLCNETINIVSDVKFSNHEAPKEIQPLGEYVTKKILKHIDQKYPSLRNDTDFIQGCLEFLDVFIGTIDASNTWNDVSTFTTYQALDGNQDLSWHVYGYKTLFEILLNKYNNGPGYPNLDIKLDMEVTKIDWPQKPEDNVVVTSKDGSTFVAKNVIVTVSVGVLQERYENLFSPQLPEGKITSIKALSLGVCDKIILRFDHTWYPANNYIVLIWREADKASVSAEDSWLLRVNAAAPPFAVNNTLTWWVCGEPAKKMESLPENVVTEKLMWLIRKFMGVGKTVPDPVELKRSTWYSNPFTRGSYTYDNLGTPEHPTARDDLAKPLVDSTGTPRVLFAGEATHTTHFSTVHGAVETGRREANRLLSL